MSTEVPEDLHPNTTKRRKRRRKKRTSTNSALYTEVRISTSWGRPRKVMSLCWTLMNMIFHEPESFTEKELVLLSELHRRLDAFCHLPWVPFIYRNTLLAVNTILSGNPLEIVASGGPDSPYLKHQYTLTNVQWLVVDDRPWLSRKATYLSAVAKKEISYQTSLVEARIERHLSSIPRPRVRGYRDKGTLRPQHKWLPPPPSGEVLPDVPDPQAELEDFIRETRTQSG